MLGMAYIRALEVASFYFMFQLQPAGSVAHIQVCGTTSCMICGAEDLIAVCRKKIASKPHELSEDGEFSWEEVECLGACSNAPMAQIGKDYFEDLTTERFGEIIDQLARGEVPDVGPQNGRHASEPATGLTSLTSHDKARVETNASVELARSIGDTVKRIDGSEVPLITPWQGKPGKAQRNQTASKAAGIKKPRTLKAPRNSGADDFQKITGIGPKLEILLNEKGFYHFDQIATWTDQECAWVDQNFRKYSGRASRDQWVQQAKALLGDG